MNICICVGNHTLPLVNVHIDAVGILVSVQVIRGVHENLVEDLQEPLLGVMDLGIRRWLRNW